MPSPTPSTVMTYATGTFATGQTLRPPLLIVGNQPVGTFATAEPKR